MEVQDEGAGQWSSWLVNGLSVLTWPFLGHCPYLVCVWWWAERGRAGVAWGGEVLTASQFSSLPDYLLKAPSPNTGTSEVRASACGWGDTSAHNTCFLLLIDYFDLGRWGVFLLQAACFLFFFFGVHVCVCVEFVFSSVAMWRSVVDTDPLPGSVPSLYFEAAGLR